MHILGISAFYHDSAAALLRDGVLVAGAHEERFTRKRHDPALPVQAVRYCLEAAGIEMKDVDYVVFYDKPFIKLERILMTYIATFPRSLPSFAKSIPVWLKEKLWIPRVIGHDLGYEGEVLFAEHHQSHAASAFLRLALRGGGDPHLRRRRRVGDHDAGRRPRQPLRAASRRSASRTRSGCSTAPSPTTWASR